MNFIFIVNDINLGSVSYSAETVVNYLLSQKRWLFTSSTPNIRLVEKGDRVLVYLAGRERRYFYARFSIADKIQKNAITERDDDFAMLNSMFHLATIISNVEIFKSSINLDKKLRERLIFIKDKKNWGLFFRQSIKVIEQDDYELIINYK